LVKLTKKMLVSGDHIASDTGERWSILWDTTSRPRGRWSSAEARTEAEALERAAHFRKLGFAVHAINDPTGATVMDAAGIRARLLDAAAAAPRLPNVSAPSSGPSSVDLPPGFGAANDHGEPGTGPRDSGDSDAE